MAQVISLAFIISDAELRKGVVRSLIASPLEYTPKRLDSVLLFWRIILFG